MLASVHRSLILILVVSIKTYIDFGFEVGKNICLVCHKTGFNEDSTHHFYLKMPCTKSGKWAWLYYSSSLCVLHFNVVFLLCRSSLILDKFPSVLVCISDLFFLYRFINFEQWYSTVTFIYHI